MKHPLLILLLLLPLSIAGQHRQKMSALVREAAASAREAKFVKGSAPSAAPFITALVSIDRREAGGGAPHQLLRDYGCRVLASWDNIFVAAIPLTSLDALASLAAVTRIEAGASNDVTLDTTHLIVHTADVWEKPLPPSAAHQGLTGKGVVVGLVDVGFDLNHPTFLSADGTECRIRRLWDQLDYSDGGDAVVGKSADGAADTVYVGRQYTTSAALHAKARSADAHIIGHGTHTAGIAAGSGSEGNGAVSPYTGMAPDAELCLVANMVTNNKTLIKPEDHYKYTTATDILAFKYIFDYADSVGKPCVINMSEGAKDEFYEAHLYHDIVNRMTGPGRIIVCSAGNEGNKGIYMHKPSGVEKQGAFVSRDGNSFLVNTSSARPVVFTLSFYLPSDTKKTVLYDTSDLADYPDSIMLDTLSVLGVDDVIIGLCTYPSGYDNTKTATEIFFNSENTSIATSVHPVALVLLDAANDVEAYAYKGSFTKHDAAPSLCGYTSDHSILFPGCIERVVCVGATAYRTSFVNTGGERMVINFGTGGERGSFSSMGPTLAGLTKPDICAPGQNVISALSSYYAEENATGWAGRTVVGYSSSGGRRYPWATDTGTSMSSPVVAGIIALWLQHCPTLTPEQVKEIFAATARRRDTSLSYPNNIYGHGEIDAVAGLDYLMQHITGIRDTTLLPPPQAPAACYDTTGRRVDPAAYRGIIIYGGKKRVAR